MKDLEEDAVKIAAEANDFGIVDCADLARPEEEGIILRGKHEGVLSKKILNRSDDPKSLLE